MPVESVKFTAPATVPPIVPVKVVPALLMIVSTDTLSTLVPLIVPTVPASRPRVKVLPVTAPSVSAAPAGNPFVVARIVF